MKLTIHIMPAANDEAATHALNLPQRISDRGTTARHRIETFVKQPDSSVITHHESRAGHDLGFARECCLARHNDDIANLLELSDALTHFRFCDRRFLHICNRELKAPRSIARLVSVLCTDRQQSPMRPMQRPKRTRQHDRTLWYHATPTSRESVRSTSGNAGQHILKYLQRPAAPLQLNQLSIWPANHWHRLTRLAPAKHISIPPRGGCECP